jgi:hypothetical protein
MHIGEKNRGPVRREERAIAHDRCSVSGGESAMREQKKNNLSATTRMCPTGGHYLFALNVFTQQQR